MRCPKQLLANALIWLGLPFSHCTVTNAQTASAWLQRLNGQHLAGVGDRCTAGDLDLDGDTDLVSIRPGAWVVSINDGVAGFRSLAMPLAGLREFAPVLIDADSDRDLDLVLATRSSLLLMVNDGRGNFRRASGSLWVGTAWRRPLVADWDADGRPDLLFRAQNGLNLLQNAGGGQFRDLTLSLNGGGSGAHTYATADWDRDGDLDVLCNDFSEFIVLENRGPAGFREFRSGRLIPQLAQLSVGDLDGDGRKEVVITDAVSAAAGRSTTILGPASQGLGYVDQSTRWFGPRDPGANHSALADVDSDGDLDLIVSGYDLSCQVWRNDRQSSFSTDSPTRIGLFGGYDQPILTDLDGDRRPDLLHPSFSGTQLAFGTASGAFDVADLSSGSTVLSNSDWCLADLDGDRVLEIACIKQGGARVLKRETPTGRFRLFADVAVTGFIFQVQAVDYDADGDLDLYVGTGTLPLFPPFPDRLFRNDGSGFVDVSAGQLHKKLADTRIVKVFDADGDGRADVFTSGTHESQLLRNTTTGLRHDPTALPAALSVSAAEIVDVDGDGDLDIVASKSETFVLLNNGQGRFSRSTGGFPTGTIAVSIDSGDIDGDGDPDLVTTSGSIFRSGQDLVWANNGSGQFQVAQYLAVGSRTSNAQFFDYDGDGDLDVLANWSPRSGSTLSYWNNQGRGRFLLDSSGQFQPPESTRRLLVRDIDGDGDQDLLLLDRTLRVLDNVSRDLAVRLRSRIGDRVELETWSRGAAAGSQAVWALSPSLARMPKPTAWGNLHLDLAGIAVTPARTLAQPVDKASLHIPRTPSLRGRSVHIQALILDANRTATGLTSPITVTIRR